MTINEIGCSNRKYHTTSCLHTRLGSGQKVAQDKTKKGKDETTHEIHEDTTPHLEAEMKHSHFEAKMKTS